MHSLTLWIVKILIHLHGNNETAAQKQKRMEWFTNDCVNSRKYKKNN